MVVCESVSGKLGNSWRKLGGREVVEEVELREAGCPSYRAGCPGARAKFLGLQIRDQLDELAGKRGMLGLNSRDFVDGNWGKYGEKLDLPATHEIHGSNPTKLHDTNISQKKLGGLFLWGFSNLGKNQQNKARKQG